MAIILTNQTPPLPTPVSSTPGVTVDVTVPAGSAGVGDELTYTSYGTVKWFVTAVSGPNVRFYEVSASCHSSRDPIYTIYGDVGERVDVTTTVTQEPGKITLNIINNQVSDVILTVVRMIAVLV